MLLNGLMDGSLTKNRCIHLDFIVLSMVRGGDHKSVENMVLNTPHYLY